MRSSTSLEKKIGTALSKSFSPPDCVKFEPGYQDNVHVLVVSGKFRGKTEKQKQDMLWQAIDESEALTAADKVRISLILPLTPDEASTGMAKLATA